MNIVRDPRLTKGEKQRVLECWICDAQLLSQAEAENMHERQDLFNGVAKGRSAPKRSWKLWCSRAYSWCKSITVTV